MQVACWCEGRPGRDEYLPTTNIQFYWNIHPCNQADKAVLVTDDKNLYGRAMANQLRVCRVQYLESKISSDDSIQASPNDLGGWQDYWMKRTSLSAPFNVCRGKVMSQGANKLHRPFCPIQFIVETQYQRCNKLLRGSNKQLQALKPAVWHVENLIFKR